MASDAASELTPADVPGLRVVARLHDQVAQGDYVRASELRMWLDNYGLTPKGRVDRRILPAVKPEAEKPAGKSKPASEYAHLKVVATED